MYRTLKQIFFEIKYFTRPVLRDYIVTLGFKSHNPNEASFKNVCIRKLCSSCFYQLCACSPNDPNNSYLFKNKMAYNYVNALLLDKNVIFLVLLQRNSGRFNAAKTLKYFVSSFKIHHN